MSSAVPRAPIERWRPTLTPLVVAPLLAGLAAMIGLNATGSTSILSYVAVFGTVAQVAAYLVLLRTVLGRGVAVSAAVGLAWLVYFTARLVITQMDRGNLNEHITVREADDWAFVSAWLLTTACLWAFVLGVRVAGPQRRLRRPRPDISSRTLLTLAWIGLMGRYAMVFGGINSGFIENIMSLYLLAFGALGFHAVTDKSIRKPLYFLVGMASLVGILASFKEAAVIPIAALTVGMAGAGVKVGKGRMLAIVGLGVMAFLTVQGGRVAFDVGDEVPIWRAPIAAVVDYDLESGTRGRPDRPINEALWDTVQGMSRRFGGVTSLIVVQEKVPSEKPYLGGLTLWQPTISALPMVPSFIHLEFPQLSLGRYFTINFIAENPDENLSSQAVTMPGDLYLNFGWVGAVVGMALWGAALGRLDRSFPPVSATGVGVVVYLSHILIGVERNVAYLFVNGAIRTVLVLALLRAVTRWGMRGGFPSSIDLRPGSAPPPRPRPQRGLGINVGSPS